MVNRTTFIVLSIGLPLRLGIDWYRRVVVDEYGRLGWGMCVVEDGNGERFPFEIETYLVWSLVVYLEESVGRVDEWLGIGRRCTVETRCVDDGRSLVVDVVVVVLNHFVVFINSSLGDE